MTNKNQMRDYFSIKREEEAKKAAKYKKRTKKPNSNGK